MSWIWSLSKTNRREKIEAAMGGKGSNPGVATGSASVAEDSALSSEIRSWVDNCLVPILVDEYLRCMQENVERLAPVAARAHCRLSVASVKGFPLTEQKK